MRPRHGPLFVGIYPSHRFQVAPYSRGPHCGPGFPQLARHFFYVELRMLPWVGSRLSFRVFMIFARAPRPGAFPTWSAPVSLRWFAGKQVFHGLEHSVKPWFPVSCAFTHEKDKKEIEEKNGICLCVSHATGRSRAKPQTTKNTWILACLPLKPICFPSPLRHKSNLTYKKPRVLLRAVLFMRTKVTVKAGNLAKWIS